MSSHLRSFLLGLTMVTIGAVQQPLHAQLNPQLQVSGTDFLDLYQQSTNLVMKPEVVTVFDFSGSMAEVMWHPAWAGTSAQAGVSNGMVFKLTGPGNNTTTYQDKYGTKLPTGRYEVTVSLTSGLTLTKGSLVRPDGTLLEYATNGDTTINSNYVNSSPLLPGETATAADKCKDVRNWIRCASHVRFTYTGVTPNITLDLPICWTILDKDTVPDTTNTDVSERQYRKSYNTSYPLRMTIINPATTSNTEVEMDTTYRTMPQGANAFMGMFTAIALDTSNRATSCTFAGANDLETNFVGWAPNYVTWLFSAASGTAGVLRADTAAGQAFKNGIPARTRNQAVKDAAMRTWAKYYNKVFWAYRFLRVYDSDTTPSDSSSTKTYEDKVYPSTDSRNTVGSINPATSPFLGEAQRGWVLLNGSGSDAALKRLAGMIPGGGTPLNSAMGSTLAQLNDPNSIFNDVETGTDKPVDCRDSYVILFTDGVPNQDWTGSDSSTGASASILSPYFSTSATAVPVVSTNNGSSDIGNKWWVTNNSELDKGDGYHNIINFAGLAAHGGETDHNGFDPKATTYPTETFTDSSRSGSKKNSELLPFWVQGRGASTEAITFKVPRAITTMTVGVSLYGSNFTDTSGSKYRLFAAAACGQPSRKSWDLTTLTPFTIDPSDTTGTKPTSSSVYFFDATDPDKLTKSLDSAFTQATLASNITASANPNLPFVGASLGQEVYIGKFQPPKSGGVIWPGDLLMFGTRENTTTGETLIIDNKADEATALDATTALWSASGALTTANKLWSTRKLYTRLPSSTATEPSITQILPSSWTTYDETKNGGLQKYLATSLPRTTTVNKNAILSMLQFVAGGDTSTVTAPTPPTANRATIMGDIINSAPAALEYKWADVKDSITSSAFPKMAAAVTAATAAGATPRFRIILVGTNQGWLHAFGEVSYKTTMADSSTSAVTQSIVKGAVDELWAFMPTDFLPYLDQLVGVNKTHQFMVDGTPAIYHLDRPTSGGGLGNGVEDLADLAYPLEPAERAIAVIGLRKGGRSYYALDIRNPFAPAMKWALVPDEADNFPTGRIHADGGPVIATVKAMLKTWGFSTCTPAFGRVQFKNVLHDAVFLGGGFSTPNLEKNFPTYPDPPANQSTPLGRSVMALDVYTGEVLAATDLTDAKIGGTTVGPVSAGLIPFEYILNSGMAQRAYFLDYNGGLWSWGSKAVSATAPYVDFRIDSSKLDEWKVRKVYRDSNTATALGARYTTLPAPFRVGSFPGVGRPGSATVAASAAPTAVGVAMVSGDRNNPLDNSYNSTDNLSPKQHRLTVVFDRQDSRAWGLDQPEGSGPDAAITDDNLMSAGQVNKNGTATGDKAYGDATITPGKPTYYLAPTKSTPPVPDTANTKFGYYVNFPGKANSFIPKGINPPIVVANSLYFTYFSPESADPCTGGSGSSYSWQIVDVKNPVLNDTRTGYVVLSGWKRTWAGVASDYIPIGTRGVLQGGSVSGAGANGSTTTPAIHTTLGISSQRYPKVRVWRTVQ